MSLSRPATFPLLKLPWLCIKCVLHNSDLFNIIYFATISDRTRRIVRSSNYPLKEIEVGVGECRISIRHQLGKEKSWYFIHDKNAYGRKLLLKINFQLKLHDIWGVHYLESYTDGDKLDALKAGIEFMIDMFRCTIGQVFFAGSKLSELFELGITSVKELFIYDDKPVNITDLKYLLETNKVTDSYVFYAPIPANFSCDPKIFKCRKLDFGCKNSADWATLELLCQFDVPQLIFWHHRFLAKDIVSYVTHWFNSENRKLEYVQFKFRNPITLGDFEIEHLNPMPFLLEDGKTRICLVEWTSFGKTDSWQHSTSNLDLSFFMFGTSVSQMMFNNDFALMCTQGSVNCTRSHNFIHYVQIGSATI